jgi:hypothetical protein
MGSAVTKRPFGVRWSSETRHLSRSLSQSRIAAAGRALGDGSARERVLLSTGSGSLFESPLTATREQQQPLRGH